MDDSTRRTLHERLDAILDRRCEIEPPPQNALGALAPWSPTSSAEHSGARQLWLATIDLAKDVLGDSIRRGALRRLYEEDRQQRKLLQSWILDLWPLVHTEPQTILAIAPKREFTIFEVMDALSALDAGEIRSLFKANTGKHRRPNRWSVARAKLEALAWKKRLRALGYAEKAANFEVTLAFGEQWDTIRKWKPQCEQILGAVHVQVSLDHAGSSQDYYVKPPQGGFLGAIKADPLKSLQSAGNAYREELRRSVELAKRKRPAG